MANLSTDCEIIQWQRVKYSSLGEKNVWYGTLQSKSKLEGSSVFICNSLVTVKGIISLYKFKNIYKTSKLTLIRVNYKLNWCLKMFQDIQSPRVN